MRLTADAFGPHLRHLRERAGASLETIAQTTKIKRSLLAGLERNDLAHWPTGIFRRAFFREYLAAIGIESESLVADFVRLFPESGPSPLEEAFHAGDSGELRLTLADAPSASSRRRLVRLAVAVTDFAVIMALGWGLTRLTPAHPLVAIGAAALVYLVTGIAATGETPAGWLAGLSHLLRRRRDRAALLPEPSAEPAQLRLVSRQADAVRLTDTARPVVAAAGAVSTTAETAKRRQRHAR